MILDFLRPPEFGNTFSFVPNTIHHRNLSGDLRTYQGSRPTWEGFHVTFTALRRSQIDDFKRWIMASAGQVITITDFEQRTWRGIISSRIVEITGGKGECNYTAMFQFEGNLV